MAVNSNNSITYNLEIIDLCIVSLETELQRESRSNSQDIKSLIDSIREKLINVKNASFDSKEQKRLKGLIERLLQVIPTQYNDLIKQFDDIINKTPQPQSIIYQPSSLNNRPNSINSNIISQRKKDPYGIIASCPTQYRMLLNRETNKIEFCDEQEIPKNRENDRLFIGACTALAIDFAVTIPQTEDALKKSMKRGAAHYLKLVGYTKASEGTFLRSEDSDKLLEIYKIQKIENPNIPNYFFHAFFSKENFINAFEKLYSARYSLSCVISNGAETLSIVKHENKFFVYNTHGDQNSAEKRTTVTCYNKKDLEKSLDAFFYTNQVGCYFFEPSYNSNQEIENVYNKIQNNKNQYSNTDVNNINIINNNNDNMTINPKDNFNEIMEHYTKLFQNLQVMKGLLTDNEKNLFDKQLTDNLEGLKQQLNKQYEPKSLNQNMQNQLKGLYELIIGITGKDDERVPFFNPYIQQKDINVDTWTTWILNCLRWDPKTKKE